MPTHPFVVSKAVHLAARPLAGMDPGLVMQLRQILGEEAQRISDELQQNGNHVNAEIIAARLDGFVRRLKHDLQDQESDLPPLYNNNNNSKASLHPMNVQINDRVKPTPVVKSSTRRLHRSSTGHGYRPRSPVSRSTSDVEFDYSTHSTSQKIRVNVIKDNATPKRSLVNSPVRFRSQKPIIKLKAHDHHRTDLTTKRPQRLPVPVRHEANPSSRVERPLNTPQSYLTASSTFLSTAPAEYLIPQSTYLPRQQYIQQPQEWYVYPPYAPSANNYYSYVYFQY